MKLIHLFLGILISLTFIQCSGTLTGTNTDLSTDSPKNPAPSPEVSNTGSFVTARNSNFMVNGESFYFSGTNAYYLPTYEKINPAIVDKNLDLFEKAGVKVIRMWGFYDGPTKYDNDISLQPEPGVYNEKDLRHLDKVIAKAKKRGIRVILTLINFWDQQGGISQYNEWDGNPGGGMKHFINDPDTQQWYKDYIKMLLNRTNTITGVKYKNEPAVFSWEIMNEGGLPKGSPTELRDWYQEIAQYIKSIDSNHMVATGEEGFESKISAEYSVDKYNNTYVLRSDKGSSYKLNTAIPEIDYGTAHWYPSAWGIGDKAGASVLKAQQAWINDHIAIAEKQGKPFVLGEYGFQGSGNSQVYDNLWSQAEETRLDGSLIWQLTAGDPKCQEFGGNICWEKESTDKALYNKFVNHIKLINNMK